MTKEKMEKFIEEAIETCDISYQDDDNKYCYLYAKFEDLLFILREECDKNVNENNDFNGD